MQRLDKALANLDWRILFHEAIVTHLDTPPTHTHSDHCPILLSLCPSLSRSPPRPFRFENIWLSHPDFRNIVDHAQDSPVTNLSSTFDLFASLVTATTTKKLNN